MLFGRRAAHDTRVGYVSRNQDAAEGRVAESSRESPYRVFVVDDHEVVRRGLQQVAGALEEFDIVGEAGGYEEALVRLDQHGLSQVDVVVIDLVLPDGEGVLLARELRHRDPRVACVIHTFFNDLQALLGARLAGAAAYVLKGAPTEKLVRAIQAAAEGRSLLGDMPIEQLLDELAEGAHGRRGHLSDLTPQEHRIFHLIGSGLTNREIGNELHLAEKTVRNYVSNMYAKLDLSRRSEAAALAARIAERARARRHRDSEIS